jgi:hypothetical protein
MRIPAAAVTALATAVGVVGANLTMAYGPRATRYTAGKARKAAGAVKLGAAVAAHRIKEMAGDVKEFVGDKLAKAEAAQSTAEAA